MYSVVLTIVSSILNILTNITTWFVERSKNTELSDNEKNRKLQDEKDEHNKVIEDAIESNDLEELRKHASE